MLVKKDLVKLAILLIAGTALLSTVCFAAESSKGTAEPPKMVKVQGVVNVTKDANGISKVTVVTKDKVVYEVVLNMKGLALGKEMADKEVEVEVEGTIFKKGTQEWIKVHSSKAVEKTAESAAPEPKPETKSAPGSK